MAKIKVGFHYVDEFGGEYSSESGIEPMGEFESTLDVIGRQFSAFLVQAGYARKRGCLFMEDVTEEEKFMLSDYLADLRSKGETNEAD